MSNSQLDGRSSFSQSAVPRYRLSEVSEDDGRCLIEPVDDAPGKEPFPMKPEDLIPEA